MKTTEDYLISNELMDVNTIVFDAYGTLLTPSALKVRTILRDFSNEKQIEIFNLLKKSQDIDDVLDAIPFHSKQKKGQFLLQLEKDLRSIRPYKESFSILDYLKDKYHIIIDSNLIPPYDEPIKENFGSLSDNIILSFQEQYAKGEKEHYKLLKQRLGKIGNEILFVGDSYKNDYEYPKRSGMNALHLQREGKTHVESIESLEELLRLLNVTK